MKRTRSREFELWVTRIEGTLVPAGAVIKSPDRIRDKFTGQWREVDASVRHRVGSVDILITIECRERSRVQDTTWIEQLATKRQHIGADRTIAVSSTPFTTAAQRAAAAHGISLRRVIDLTAEELLSPEHRGIQVMMGSLTVKIDEMRVTFDGPVPHQPHPSLRDAFLLEAFDAKVFKRGDGVMSIDEIFADGSLDEQKPLTFTVQPMSSMVVSKNHICRAIGPHVPADGTQVTKEIAVDLDAHAPPVTMLTAGGSYSRVLGVVVRVTATQTMTHLPPARVSSYSDESKTIGKFSEHTLDMGNGSILSVISHPTSVTDKEEEPSSASPKVEGQDGR